MSSISAKTPAATHKDVVQISNNNSGIDGTVRQVEDGEGTQGPFGLSTTIFRILTGKVLDLVGTLQIGGTNLTKGALVTGTGAGAVQMLAVGSNNQVVVADSATANGVKWANKQGWSVLASTVASGASAVGFPTCFSSNANIDSFYVEVVNLFIASAGTTGLYFRMSNDGSTYDSSAGHYGWAKNEYDPNSASATYTRSTSDTAARLMTPLPSINSASVGWRGRIDIVNPHLSGSRHAINSAITAMNNGGVGEAQMEYAVGSLKPSPSAAVTGFQLYGAGALTGTVRVWGLVV